MVVDRGHRRDEEHGGRLDPAPDLGAEQAQPHGREQARVQREQDGARGVHQPLGRPRLPADPAAHRMPPLVQPDREQPHGDHDEPGEGDARDERRGNQPGEGAERGLAEASEPAMPAATTAPPAAKAAIGSSERKSDEAPYATSQRVRRGGGRWSGRPGRSARRAILPSAGRRARDRTPRSPARSRRPSRSARREAACCVRRWSSPRRCAPGRCARRRRRSTCRRGRPRARSRRDRRSSACRSRAAACAGPRPRRSSHPARGRSSTPTARPRARPRRPGGRSGRRATCAGARRRRAGSRPAQAGEQDPRSEDRDGHASERRGEDREADEEHPQRHRRQEPEVVAQRVEDRRRGEQVEQPSRPAEDEQRHADERLHPLGAARRRDRLPEGRRSRAGLRRAASSSSAIAPRRGWS